LAGITKLVRTFWPLAVALAFAGSAGFFAAQALGIGSQAPTSTVTVDVGTGVTGPQGPAGPAGPPGSPGAESCPTGSTFKAVLFNTPGGHTTIYTCVQNGP